MRVRLSDAGGISTAPPVSSGSANWLPIFRPAVALRTILKWSGLMAVGVSLRIIAKMLMRSSVATKLTGIYKGTILCLLKPAISLRTYGNFGTPRALGAGKIVKVTTNLAGAYGATSQTISPSSGNGIWTNPSNALGQHDGVNATVAGQTLNAVDSILNLKYPGFANKTALTITNVIVVFYASLTKGLSGSPTLALRYSINGGTSYTTAQTLNATASGPFTFDITSIIAGSWANLQNLAAQLEFITAALTGVSDSATCDAVEFQITAINTVTP